jgi:hypothetical protein
MDPGDILQRGRTNASEGRHEQALADYLWFHKNALKHKRAYYGVRLSFALGYWKELSDVYPPAAAAMKAVRDETAAALLKAGGNTRTLFHDVVAIDHELGRSPETYRLFLSLMKKNPDQAKKCADLALPSIIEAGDYQLAKKFLLHPEDYLLYKSERLNESLGRKDLPRRRALAELDAFVHIYCKDVKLLLRVLEGVGEKAWRCAALEWAIALVGPRKARSMVALQLTLHDA